MSDSIQSLGKKIGGAGDLQSVVRSMKALAASSILQYERAVSALDDYEQTVAIGLALCLRRSMQAQAMIQPSRSGEPAIGAIVFGSDQGLVGRFNEVLLDFVIHQIKAVGGTPGPIWVVGERMRALIVDRGLKPPQLSPVPTSAQGIAPLVGELLVEMESAQAQGGFSELHVFHNRPQNSGTYAPAARVLLPLDPAWHRQHAERAWPGKAWPEVIDGDPAALQAFIREYLFVVLFQACAESLASENASRLAAMQRADKNIEDILETLNQRFHRQRQAAIDEELFDVIAGYEALSKPGSDVDAQALAPPPGGGGMMET
ncbi:MAG: F0F1 ATP synthase subunit gamma [Salinisphaera sp.]|uniref:F0F1 ATP synthase subunit gamma n=1 Tax=Salinisphaera sp. TaxID=1914330 RepID=UPI003C7D75D4